MGKAKYRSEWPICVEDAHRQIIERLDRVVDLLEAAAPGSVPGSNPLRAVDVYQYGALLRSLLRSLDRQVVMTAFVGESEPDLLGPEGQEVDRVREFLNRWIGAVPQAADLGGSGLAVLDAFEDELLSAAEHGGSPLNESSDLSEGVVWQ